ncbi:MAG: PucR family transcriptional regulator ligand-binding domain-containing protein [Nocardioidaceae bacterium]
MPVTLGQIVSQAELGLVPVAAVDLDRIVRWVTITELPDPSRWLDGGELVLTTGLRQRTAGEQAGFVESLCSAKAAALGFGVGLSHDSVPQAVVQTAQAHDLPLLVVPYETPFIAVTRFIADRMSQEHASQLQSLLDAHEQLGQALLSGQGLQELLHVFAQITQAPAAVVDLHGSLLASAPPLASWPIEQITELLRDREAGPEPVRRQSLDVHPVIVEGRVVAAFCARAPGQAEHLLGDVSGYAAQLAGLEMARRQAVLAGRRELAGQVLEDIVRAAISTSEAERRLTAVGVDPHVGHQLVLGIVDANHTAMRNLPWTIHPTTDHPGADERSDPVVTAMTGRYFAAICTETQPVHDTAHMMSEYLRNLGQGVCVGIGGVYSGVDGLRWSFFEARDALGKGAGIHEGEPLSLPRLLVANPELPVQELARAALRPVLEADGEVNRTLADTLRVFLELDGSVSATADRLFIHRNTVRYRLTQVERLTGRSLASTQDRVHLWLALMALGDPPAMS